MDCNRGLAWFGFWIFLAVVFTYDHCIFLHCDKTEAEKKLQRLKIEELRLKIELLKRAE